MNVGDHLVLDYLPNRVDGDPTVTVTVLSVDVDGFDVAEDGTSRAWTVFQSEINRGILSVRSL